MTISLMGYMGSGKTHISKLLSQKLNFRLFDLDEEIIFKNEQSIPEIFQKRGEIFFRKEERARLESILTNNTNIVISLGGGTPAYYDNIKLINKASESIYLQASVATLTERLASERELRPVLTPIKEENLAEFVAKHLFERQPFYSQAKYTVRTDGKTPEKIVTEIIHLISQ